MKKALVLSCFLVSLAVSFACAGEFRQEEYRQVTQVELVKDPEAYEGRKVRVTDAFLFCGSDFCVDLQRKNINTREYYCFAVGPLCMVRMYIKRDHPDAEQLGGLKKGDRLTAYGVFDHMGSNYRYILVDRLVVEKDR